MTENERRLWLLMDYHNWLTLIAIKGDDNHMLRHNIALNRRRRIELAHGDADVKVRSPFWE
uniref:Uncharacterized protein n=2 Tax=Lacticaseibacillus saniviri TaxID=931533 RepID=A0A0R2MV15_9LACO|nr:hypothetical protein [Lacticaseibacillus saniviri]KRO17335.1 hypothetical protein IV56_GL000354 [Lacticaseibacillus saniviri JCM 17471 = DSM 24301]